MTHIPQEESMKGLFFIIKGQYRKKEPTVVCEDREARSIGGYDPEDETNENWYMVLDNVVFHCCYGGSDLDRAVEVIENMIKKHKTRKSYFQMVCKYTSEDYYEVHYQHKAPLTHEQRNKKAEGRCPRTSPAMKALYKEVFKAYGDYFEDLITEAEDSAYRAIKADKPLNKALKRHKRLNMPKQEEKTSETPFRSSEEQPKKASGMKLKKPRKFGKK